MTNLSLFGLAFVAVLSSSACKHANASGASDGGAASAASAPTTHTTPTTSATANAGVNANGACSIVGIFEGRVATFHGPGASTMATGADGAFSIAVTLDANHATTTLKGKYTTSGGQITFVNGSGGTSNGRPIMACLGVHGVYATAWSADCKRITLHKVSDSCPPREQEADGTTLTRK